MSFSTTTAWNTQLRNDGSADHIVTCTLRDLGSALDEQSQWQLLTIAAPAEVALDPVSVRIQWAGGNAQLKQRDVGLPVNWDYDGESRQFKLNLAALDGFKQWDLLDLRMSLKQSAAVICNDTYDCYWLGLQSRLGGPVKATVSFPPYVTWWGRAFEWLLILVRFSPYEQHVFSLPGCKGIKQRSPTNGIVLDSAGEVPVGHFVFFRRKRISIRGSVPTIIWGVVSIFLWTWVVEDRVKQFFALLGFGG